MPSFLQIEPIFFDRQLQTSRYVNHGINTTDDNFKYFCKLKSFAFYDISVDYQSVSSISLLPFQCQNLGKIFTGQTHKLLLGFTIIPDVYRSFIPNKLHLISTVLLRGFQGSPGVRKNLVNFTGLLGTVNAMVYKTEPISTGLWHTKLS